MQDEFNELFIKKDDLNKELLKEILLPNIRLLDDGTIIFQNLSIQQNKKIVIYLLGNKIFNIREIKKNDAETPTIISKNTGIPLGTVKRSVRELVDLGIIKQNEKGEYFVPNFNLSKVKEWIKSEE